MHACIFRGCREIKLDKNSSDIERMGHEAMQRFIKAPGCRRAAVGALMDGEGDECDKLGVERCDRCEDRALEAGGEEPSLFCSDDDKDAEMDRAKEHRQAQSRRQLAQEQWLDEVGNRCGVCYVQWSRRGRSEEERRVYKHRPEHCRYIPVDEYAAWRRRLEFADFHCCWGCGLPRTRCEAAGIDMDTGRCRYRDQILPVVMMATKSKRLGEMVRKEFGVDTGDAAVYGEWVCRKRPTDGREVTNGFAVWDMIVQSCIHGAEA